MSAEHTANGHSEGHLHGPSYYVKIWAILLVLLIISLIGPEFGIRWLTIVTAFGIAIVKAMMVCAYFMHLNIEKKLIWYMLIVMLLCVGLFWFGTKTDINHTSGSNWIKNSSLKMIEDNKDWHDKLEHH
jgi:caa(3)-type oxidase subunit IV